MSETVTLVSWDAPQNLGKIPGSDWVRPVGSLGAIGDFEKSGGIITDEVVRGTAQGRHQHLEMLQFPEGYHAVTVVDSETGKVLTGSNDTYRYGGLTSCNCDTSHAVPAVTSVLSGRPIEISDDRQITAVENGYDGTKTAVKPTQVDRPEHDYISRLRTIMEVTPRSHNLYLLAEGPIGAIDRAHAKLDLRQNGPKIRGELTMWVSDDMGEDMGQLALGLDSDGQVKGLSIYKLGFLKALDVDTSAFDLSSDSDWAEITKPEHQDVILGATAEVLDFEKWQGLDLRLTASGLYANMGQRNFNPTTILVPRS